MSLKFLLQHLRFEESKFSWQVQVRLRTPLYDSLAVNSYESGEGICPHVDLLRYEDGIAIVSLLSAVNMEFSLGSTQGIPSAAVNLASLDQSRGSQPAAYSSYDHLDGELDSTSRMEIAHLTADDADKMAKSVDEESTASPTSLQRPIGDIVFGELEQPIQDTKRCPDQLVRLEPGDVLTLHSAARYVWTHGILAVPVDMWHGQTVDRRRRISLTFRTLSRA